MQITTPIRTCPPGGLVFKAHRLVYHSTLGLRVIKKKKKEPAKTSIFQKQPKQLHTIIHQDSEVHLQGYLAHKKPTPP